MYKVVDGWNNAGTLAVVTPQPASPGGVRYPDVRYSGAGRAFQGFPFVDLVWTSLERDQYNTILTQYGLSQTVASNDVTAAVRDNNDAFSNYNATASHALDADRGMAFWRNLTIRLELIGVPT